MELIDKQDNNSQASPWKGKPPKDDEEARERIIQAARACIKRDGVTGANISAVAKQVGVTRRTVYRLFDSTGHLIQTIAAQSTGVTLNKMMAHVNNYPSFQERVVEAIIYLKKAIKKDSFLKVYFSTDASSGNQLSIADTFTPEALELSFQMLKVLYPQDSRELDQQLFRQLAEHIQRILFSLVLTPSPSTDTDSPLREYLNNWLTPGVDALLKGQKYKRTTV